ncbi:MAG: hypothetical protein DMG12_04005 [Acidobacteria bacterium]|nr:MAG: hypothetical protein DMG12_04005 [Acidobacteriota bacterium]
MSCSGGNFRFRIAVADPGEPLWPALSKSKSESAIPNRVRFLFGRYHIKEYGTCKALMGPVLSGGDL